jgi:single-strand DNA-binding protein
MHGVIGMPGACETWVTVAGHAASDVECRVPAHGVPRARFRLVTTDRRYDRERAAWGEARSSHYTVLAWRQLALNVRESVVRGEPLLVRGLLRGGEIEAAAIGHNLAFGAAVFHRVTEVPRAREAAGPTVAGICGDRPLPGYS